ncbi:hypothetical protein K438DRAFT_1975973 [Mycena galopus ATCC 62051]|nr:hypothetical protein K438DRAFT_1975973 [Mycena galopus ATCC 62051]
MADWAAKRPAASSPSFNLAKTTFRIASIVFAAKLGKFAPPTSSSAARSTTRSATLNLLPRTETQWAAGANEALASPSVQLPPQPHIPTLTPAIERRLRDAGLRRIGSDTAEGVRDDEVVQVEAEMEIEMEKVGWEMLPHPESGGSIRVPLAVAVDCHGRPRTMSTRSAAATRITSTATAKQATTRVASTRPPGRALGQEHVDGGDTTNSRGAALFSFLGASRAALSMMSASAVVRPAASTRPGAVSAAQGPATASASLGTPSALQQPPGGAPLYRYGAHWSDAEDNCAGTATRPATTPINSTWFPACALLASTSIGATKGDTSNDVCLSGNAPCGFDATGSSFRMHTSTGFCIFGHTRFGCGCGGWTGVQTPNANFSAQHSDSRWESAATRRRRTCINFTRKGRYIHCATGGSPPVRHGRGRIGTTRRTAGWARATRTAQTNTRRIQRARCEQERKPPSQMSSLAAPAPRRDQEGHQ